MIAPPRKPHLTAPTISLNFATIYPNFVPHLPYQSFTKVSPSKFIPPSKNCAVFPFVKPLHQKFASFKTFCRFTFQQIVFVVYPSTNNPNIMTRQEFIQHNFGSALDPENETLQETIQKLSDAYDLIQEFCRQKNAHLPPPPQPTFFPSDRRPGFRT